MALHESIYKFKISDTKYISLLTHYVGHLPIASLEPNFSISLNNKTIDDLPLLIEQIKAKAPKDFILGEMKLITRYCGQASLLRVLPEFESEEYVVDQRLEKITEKIQSYISKYLNSNTQESAPLELELLSHEDAWKILNRVHKKVPFLSAFQSPSSHCITMLYKKHLFILNYNRDNNRDRDPFFHPSIRIDNEVFTFDLDDGFREFTGYWRNPYDVAPPEITEPFEKWVKNNRSGFIFPFPKKKIEILSNEIRQHTSLNLPLPNNLAEIIAEYAYTPYTNMFTPQTVLNKQPKNSTAPLKSSIPISRLAIRLLLLAASTGAVITLGAYFIGFSLPAGIITLAAIFAGMKLIKSFINKRTKEKALHVARGLDPKSHPNDPNEIRAFHAGISAQESYRGLFNAWCTKASYSNYIAYRAGKQVAQQNAPHARYEYK